jgi:hypothetical protein
MKLLALANDEAVANLLDQIIAKNPDFTKYPLQCDSIRPEPLWVRVTIGIMPNCLGIEVDTRSKRKTYAIGNQYPSGNVGNL